MSNITNNRVDKVLTDSENVDLVNAFKTLQTLIEPWAKSLTMDERKTLPKMDEVNSVFVGDTLVQMATFGNILPPYLAPERIDTDKKLYDQLEGYKQWAYKIAELIEDTQMLAGSEAYTSSLTVYRLFEAAAKAVVPGADTAYNALKERFKSQGGPAPEPQQP